MNLQPVIGLEVHVQLKTKSKMFCGCSNAGENEPPNTTICPICTAQPGVLPVANKQAIEWAALTSLALGCEVNEFSKFDRKNYFYPDLPKGYQISQYDQPIGRGGFLVVEVPGGRRRVRIERLHLEEDAGKTTHPPKETHSLVDFNRAGTPLMEIVSQPDLRAPAEAKAYLQELRQMVRALGVSEADMEKGHLRCDANVSLNELDDKGRPVKTLNPKTEIKNINSFLAVERALTYEIARQKELYATGAPPTANTTRGWDDDEGITKEQRIKEGEADYRYFPEPDLPPLRFTPNWLNEMRAKLPELPQAKRQRFMEMYGFDAKAARLLTEVNSLADYVEQVISEMRGWFIGHGQSDKEWYQAKAAHIKLLAGWITSRLFRLWEDKKLDFDQNPVTAENLGQLMVMIHRQEINSSAAQKLLELMVETKGDPKVLMTEHNLGQTSNKDEILAAVKSVIAENQSQVDQFKTGKEVVLQYLIGQVMRLTKGKANPELAKDLLLKEIKS